MKRNQRYETRMGKRKQNRYLNIAIIIVVLLIGIVAYNLLSGDDSETASTGQEHQSEQKDTVKDDTNNNASVEMESDKEDKTADKKEDQSQSDTKKEESDENSTDQDGQTTDEVSGGGPEGPWEPIGTSQSEPHQKSYDSSSQDWQEMTKALSYASGIPESDMTIIWLGNGGGPDLSTGTVKSKADGKQYKIDLQWVPEKGWKPVNVAPAE